MKSANDKRETNNGYGIEAMTATIMKQDGQELFLESLIKHLPPTKQRE